MTSDLATVLERAHADAATLRRHGDVRLADSIELLCAQVAEAADDWLSWLSEQQAIDRSAKAHDYFRARRTQWELDGLARREGRRWYYRRCIVPRSRLSSVQRNAAAMERAG